MNPSDVVWLAVVVLGTAAVTAAAVFPLGVRWGARHAEHRAEHEIVQAVLWATEPLEVLSFYAQYRLAPPDVSAYVDDQIAKDPALDQLTRRPAPRVASTFPTEWPRNPDGTPVGLVGINVRPPVPPSDEDEKQEAPTPPPAVEPNPAATSHRAMRRSVIGWLDETWTRITGNGDELEADGVRPDNPPPAEPNPAPPADPPAPEPVPYEGPPLLDLPTLDVCARCKGTQRIVDEVPAIRITDVLEPARTLWRPCPDCCCPEYGCGTHTGDGRLCPPHQHDDDIRQEDAAKRAADR